MKLEENNPLMEVLASRGRRTGGSYTPGSACFRVLQGLEIRKLGLLLLAGLLFTGWVHI